MEGLFFNVDAGYAEAIVRGYRAGLLSNNQYSNMTQCDSLEDLRLQLASTEYGDFMANVPSPLSTREFQDRAFKRMIDQFRYLQSVAVAPLTQFLDYITYGYMIDNVMLLLSGAAHHRDMNALLLRTHPLGWFETLPALTVASDVTSLYETVLIDTPLAPYFKDCLSVDELSDLQIEVVRNKLYKAYLEDFSQWCAKTLPTPSDEIMASLLSFEADRRTVNVALNSLNTSITTADKHSLFPNLGSLYPSGTSQLARAEDADQVRAIIETYGAANLQPIFDNSNDKTIEDHFYAIEMQMCKSAMTQQFTYSTFFAWLKAAEQEVRNVIWIAECIAQDQRNRIQNYVAVF